MSKLRRRLRHFYKYAKRKHKSIFFQKNGTMLH